MKLTADSQGRLGSAELFRPRAGFGTTVQTDGSVHLVELAQVPLVKSRRVDGRLRGAEVDLSRETVPSGSVCGEVACMIDCMRVPPEKRKPKPC